MRAGSISGSSAAALRMPLRMRATPPPGRVGIAVNLVAHRAARSNPPCRRPSEGTWAGSPGAHAGAAFQPAVQEALRGRLGGQSRRACGRGGRVPPRAALGRALIHAARVPPPEAVTATAALFARLAPVPVPEAGLLLTAAGLVADPGEVPLAIGAGRFLQVPMPTRVDVGTTGWLAQAATTGLYVLAGDPPLLAVTVDRVPAGGRGGPDAAGRAGPVSMPRGHREAPRPGQTTRAVIVSADRLPVAGRPAAYRFAGGDLRLSRADRAVPALVAAGRPASGRPRPAAPAVRTRRLAIHDYSPAGVRPACRPRQPCSRSAAAGASNRRLTTPGRESHPRPPPADRPVAAGQRPHDSVGTCPPQHVTAPLCGGAV